MSALVGQCLTRDHLIGPCLTHSLGQAMPDRGCVHVCIGRGMPDSRSFGRAMLDPSFGQAMLDPWVCAGVHRMVGQCLTRDHLVGPCLTHSFGQAMPDLVCVHGIHCGSRSGFGSIAAQPLYSLLHCPCSPHMSSSEPPPPPDPRTARGVSPCSDPKGYVRPPQDQWYGPDGQPLEAPSSFHGPDGQPLEAPSSFLKRYHEAMAENPATVPVNHPVGKHGPYQSSGAAWHREQRRLQGIAAHRTNPYKKELQHAEKQLRGTQRKGLPVFAVMAAQLKVEHMKGLKEVWETTNRGGSADLDQVQRNASEYAKQKGGTPTQVVAAARLGPSIGFSSSPSTTEQPDQAWTSDPSASSASSWRPQ